jgi:hypothetical protein
MYAIKYSNTKNNKTGKKTAHGIREACKNVTLKRFLLGGVTSSQYLKLNANYVVNMAQLHNFISAM